LAIAIASALPSRSAIFHSVAKSSRVRAFVAIPPAARKQTSMPSARTMRRGSPTRSDRMRFRVWKYAPRMLSVIEKPAPADHTASARTRARVLLLDAGRSVNERPRMRSARRAMSTEKMTAMGLFGK
jgi:hypothetical protein